MRWKLWEHVGAMSIPWISPMKQHGCCIIWLDFKILETRNVTLHFQAQISFAKIFWQFLILFLVFESNDFMPAFSYHLEHQAYTRRPGAKVASNHGLDRAVWETQRNTARCGKFPSWFLDVQLFRPPVVDDIKRKLEALPLQCRGCFNSFDEGLVESSLRKWRNQHGKRDSSSTHLMYTMNMFLNL